MIRKSPPLPRPQSHLKASSRSLPPPIMAIPNCGLAWESSGLPMRAYLNFLAEAAGEAAARNRHSAAQNRGRRLVIRFCMISLESDEIGNADYLVQFDYCAV